MGEDSGEKTEQPTPNKLREARKKGQVTKSKDLTAAFLLVISFYALKFSGVKIWMYMIEMTHKAYFLIPAEFSPSLAGMLLDDVMWTFLKAVMPLFMINFFAAIILEVLQTNFVFSTESISPDLNKLNIIEGVKKLFSLKQVVELFKSLIKMAIVVFLIISAIREDFEMVLVAQQVPLWTSMEFAVDVLFKIILRIGLVYLIIGIFDYFYQKYEYIKGLKMSKKEIKDEYKRMEGDPLIKQRQRDAAREMSQGRQTGAVPGADVVVTNPTHIAVAIAYKPGEMKAPKVLAKGENLIAQTIRDIAEENDIPIIENKPLARALFRKSNIDQEVLPEFYKAVAEILAFVYNLKAKRKRRY